MIIRSEAGVFFACGACDLFDCVRGACGGMLVRIMGVGGHGEGGRREGSVLVGDKEIFDTGLDTPCVCVSCLSMCGRVDVYVSAMCCESWTSSVEVWCVDCSMVKGKD